MIVHGRIVASAPGTGRITPPNVLPMVTKRRRWTMRVRTAADQEATLVIAVPPGDGTVCASLGSTAVRLEPADVSRLIDLYRLAQAAALDDRGRW